MKRASPSRGSINASACAPTTTLVYANAGASVISVLTEPNHFHGSPNDLTLVRKLFPLDGNVTRPSVLRKDFILDRYMILESRLLGADSILLIVAIIPSESTLRQLISYSQSLGMEPLVEVATIEEMKIACKAGARVVGINNRDLHSFQVDMSTTGRVAEAASEGVRIIALSGVKCRGDVLQFGKGIAGVLVGGMFVSLYLF